MHLSLSFSQISLLNFCLQLALSKSLITFSFLNFSSSYKALSFSKPLRTSNSSKRIFYGSPHYQRALFNFCLQLAHSKSLITFSFLNFSSSYDIKALSFSKPLRTGNSSKRIFYGSPHYQTAAHSRLMYQLSRSS
jgi:hypothetical protein